MITLDSILVGVLIVLYLMVLPSVMFKFKPKKIRLTKVGMIRFWVGYLAIGLSIMFFIGGITALQISHIFDEFAKTLTDILEKSIQTQKASDISSFGWAYIAVGFGLMFSGIQFVLDALERRL